MRMRLVSLIGRVGQVGRIASNVSHVGPLYASASDPTGQACLADPTYLALPSERT
jgi:hypothetical protein